MMHGWRDGWMDGYSKRELWWKWVFPWGRFRGPDPAVSAVNHSPIMPRSCRPIQQFDNNSHVFKRLKHIQKRIALASLFFSHIQRCSSLGKHGFDRSLDVSGALINLFHHFWIPVQCPPLPWCPSEADRLTAT